MADDNVTKSDVKAQLVKLLEGVSQDDVRRVARRFAQVMSLAAGGALVGGGVTGQLFTAVAGAAAAAVLEIVLEKLEKETKGSSEGKDG